jgi:molybdenum cofactor cytidylyltransferase
MGRSKQLLPAGGETLLHRAVSTALRAAVGDVWVVLGSEAERHALELSSLETRIIVNRDWQSGMGSSIKKAVHELANMSYEALLFMVCDQPLLTPNHLMELVRAARDPQVLIAASAYGQSVGVPAVFRAARFPDLIGLDDRAGAKKVIADHPASTRLIPFEAAACDLDTQEDYERYLQSVGERPDKGT